MEYGLIVTILCLTIVFGILILLIGALYLMRFLTDKFNKKNSKDSSANQIEENIEEDKNVIAAITAAINVVINSQKEEKKAKFIVRTIKRI